MDHRGHRSAAEERGDGELTPSATARAFEELLLQCLKESNSPLSTRLYLHSLGRPALEAFVHRDLDRLVYETVPRRTVLDFLENCGRGSSCCVRTFFPPVTQPRKHVRMFALENQAVRLVPATATRLVQTQGGALDDEPNTTYL